MNTLNRDEVLPRPHVRYSAGALNGTLSGTRLRDAARKTGYFIPKLGNLVLLIRVPTNGGNRSGAMLSGR